jgi:hypothetical protein
MQYNYTEMTRTDHIKFANDAGSCYDRIIASPSNVLACSRGFHRNIAALHGNMLETATYRIKTQLGISTTSYSHNLLNPVFGTGQGSRSSARIHNFYIMEHALTLTFSDRDIRLINYCRFYLEATTVSDLCTASGTHLQINATNGSLPLQSISKLSEPYLEFPGPLAWRAWRRFLLTFSEPNGQLFRPLGPWLLQASQLRRYWPFLFSPSRQILYKWCTDSYLPLHPTRYRLFNPISPDRSMDIPLDCLPIDAIHTSDGWRISSRSTMQPPPPANSCFPKFLEYIERLPDHERTCLLRFNLLGSNVYGLTQSIQDFDDYILVSDGGPKDDYGSYGWIFSHRDGTRLAKGMGSVFGIDPKSYRAEISGCRAALLFIHHSFLYCNTALPPGTLQIYCDNEGFVKKINLFRSFRIAAESCCLHSEWDLLISIHRLCQTFHANHHSPTWPPGPAQ